MKGDIALVGFLFCARDWEAFDAGFRAELMAAAALRDGCDGWVVAPATGILSGPIRVILPTDAAG
ncbi:MAG TPA: hypothetical protein VH143_14220 [Kofleriaceae bacterium]|jgi:hypothetical protein|nr:hypothetical protein [Kofleriaceae bacterium]